MPRKERITHVGEYHVINRGVERRNIFLDAEDYDYFQELLALYLPKFNIILHAYCLMSNHYHLLLETKENNISLFMKKINSLYSIYFNKKYKRTGHLWQGRFASFYLYADAHFWHVAKYIERNPIKANIVKKIDHYKHQSFFQWKYKQTYFSLLNESKIFDMTLKEYENYISTDIHKDALEIIYTTPKVIQVNNESKILYKRLETFFHKDINFNRNANIIKAYEYGYTKTEIANCLNLSHTSICKIIGV